MHGEGPAAGAAPAVVEVRREWVTYFLRVTLEAAEIPSQDVALSPRADSAEAQGGKHSCGQAPGQGTEGHAKSQGRGRCGRREPVA